MCLNSHVSADVANFLPVMQVAGHELHMVIYYEMHRYLAILLCSKYIYDKIKLMLSYN